MTADVKAEAPCQQLDNRGRFGQAAGVAFCVVNGGVSSRTFRGDTGLRVAMVWPSGRWLIFLIDASTIAPGFDYRCRLKWPSEGAAKASGIGRFARTSRKIPTIPITDRAAIRP